MNEQHSALTSNSCNCPNGSYGQKHTAECYQAQIKTFAERLADCEISLGTFDPGAVSEYWLKYAPGAMHARTAPETVSPPDAVALLRESQQLYLNSPAGLEWQRRRDAWLSEKATEGQS